MCREMTSTMDYKGILKKAGAVLLALAFWQIVAMKLDSKILLVTPVEVLKRLATIWKVQGFATSIWFTFYHIISGYFLAIICGILFAILASKWNIVETLLWPWVITIKTVPVASFIVICLIWMPVGGLSVFISFLIVFPIIYQNVLEGLRNRDAKLHEMAEVFCITWYKRMKYITMPKLKPFLMSALSVSCGMAWKAGVAAEIIGVPNGSIGKMLHNAKMYLATDDLLAWTVILVILSVAFEKVFMYIMSKVL